MILQLSLRKLQLSLGLVLLAMNYMTAVQAIPLNEALYNNIEATLKEEPTVESLSMQILARRITVRVKSGRIQGSGILIRSQNGSYTVLTCEHVLELGNPITVDTADGRSHRSFRLGRPVGSGIDLALLTFISKDVIYPIATLGKGLQLVQEEPVLAAGFPDISSNGELHIELAEGVVTRVLSKYMEGGYQVGYSSTVQKGMSGGPLLNRKGEVVAMNGRHKFAFAIWGDPYIFADNSIPDPQLHEIMKASSWAVPLERLKYLGKSKR